MSYKNVRERWKLDVWWQNISNIEDYVSQIAERKKMGIDIDNLLIRNFAKMSLSMREIFTLLDNGYPDGALTISRTVYEITILTEFIYINYEKEHSTILLERYFEDQNVKAYINLKDFNKNIAEKYGIEELEDKVKELDREICRIKNKYGHINNGYWWANIVFNRKSPTFSEIDNFVHDDFILRMLYKRACISVHASSLGAFALLGRENVDGNLLYTTQTDDGFEAPLLLAMVSVDRFLDVMCNYWNFEKNKVVTEMNNEVRKYINRILFNIE